MKSRRRAGFSLLEVVISVSLFASVMGALISVVKISSDHSTLLRNQGNLDEKARQVTNTITRELRWAEIGTLLRTVENGSSRLDFRVPMDYSGGAVTWSTNITIKWLASTIDADNDGVADDGAIVRIQNGTTQTLCNFVPQGGFQVTAAGANLTVALSLNVRDGVGRLVTARVSESTSPRN